MAETPKRRLLRRGMLQASPFGTPIKPFTITPGAGAATGIGATSVEQSSKQQSSSMANPFLATESNSTDELGSIHTSPMSRKSPRLSTFYPKDMPENALNGSNSLSRCPSTPKKMVGPMTPKSKTIIKMGIWGHVVGLKRLDETVYYRYPVDKSYCSFGRSKTNDIRVQIDGVSDMHCKLIRRDDGEVWLKDTSMEGTFLNDVLIHDTARPIQHNDVITIAGRKFRFESAMPTFGSEPAPALNTPHRHISSIQESIDLDIQLLSEAPSPTTGRILGTPKRSLSRSSVALESSLGLFTPNRAAKLESLLVSPKPIPLPAFLAKSPGRLTTTPRKVLKMIDEPSILNPTCTVIQQPTVEIEPGLQTPSRDKRKAPIDFEDEILGRTPKKVSFGPALSPEIFDETNPPSTPIKRGEQQGTETPRRQGISTPSLLSRLSAVTPSAKPILTPTRAGGRIANWAGLVKPAPLNLLADINQEREEEATGSTDGARIQTKAQGMGYTNNLEVFDEDHSANHSGNDGRDKIVKDHDKEPMLLQELQDTIDGVDEMYLQLTEQVEEGDDDISPPPSPTRTPIGRASTPLLSTSLSRPRRLSFGMYQQEDLHQTNKLSSPTFVSGNESDLIEQAIHGEEREPSITDVAIQLDGSKDNASFVDTTGEAQIQLKLSSSSYSTPPRRTATTMDKTPVHTPVQYRSPANLQQNDSASRRSTPGSASRLALLQLSTQKIRGLPELLQSPSSTTLEPKTTNERCHVS